ncbi:unnamed protein product [Bemisia tabaci]|uniref:Ionotropic receptor n=1 Tax=Bemisia tabaci TaxID=7038 RepID=A0A9P0EZE9_BEMTA|nr:unnamed protein product [Bemisia tabaci]
MTTILTNRSDFSNFMMDEVSKNIVFVVNDCSDIVNVMLNTMRGYSSSCHYNTNNTTERLMANNYIGPQSVRQKSEFPNICIFYDSNSGAALRDFHRPCDAFITVNDEDIQNGSVLKKELLDFTDGAFNKIWNPDNYLIFVVFSDARGNRSEVEEQGLSCNLPFIFRLIWRIFKGRKTVICTRAECFWYDSFFNRTHVFKGSKGEKYFNFEWRSLNRKTLRILSIDTSESTFELQTGHNQWKQPVFNVLDELAKRRKGLNFILPSNKMNEDLPEHKNAIKYDIDFMMIDATPRLRTRNYENYDHTVVTNFGSFCFFVPRKGFKPQYLTVFKCFSLKLWVCFLITTTTFLLVHYFHKRFQLQQLAHLYSEYELIQYESLSTTLTIYRYFLCVSQPRLLLGKLMSGKILFIIFAFGAIILTTLLQSGMVTFLSTLIRYADIDTIHELAESDLLIQSPHLDEDAKFLSKDQKFDWIRERLVESFSLQ